jgi:hypothetical protein
MVYSFFRAYQEVVANCDHLSNLKFSKYPPNVFTEHEAAIKKLSVPQSKRRIGFHTDLNSQKNKNEKE